jgi:flagellin
MPAVLNTNVASLWASKNLLGAQSKMADSVERLSSGLRINRARDDAAGLGIAQSLTAQINGANQGIRNLNDGISMVQTADGAIAAATDMGQRILTLATQASNSTLGSRERESIKNEMLKLIDSIDSISSRTKFAGNSLLSASGGNDTDPLYKIQISNVSSDTVDLNTEAFRNIGGKTVTERSTATLEEFASLSAGDHTIYVDVSTDHNAGPVIENYKSFTLTVEVAGNGDRTYTIADDLDGSIDTANSFAGSTVYDLTDVNAFDAGTGTMTLNMDDAFFVGLSFSQEANSGKASAMFTAVSDSDTSDADTFRNVQTEAQAYVDSLVSQRSLLGAYQNQMEYIVSNVTELSGNLSAAKSRVIDTDYAAETANLTKGQILQQAATAMLAQANQMPNVILTLLK